MVKIGYGDKLLKIFVKNSTKIAFFANKKLYMHKVRKRDSKWRQLYNVWFLMRCAM